MTEVLNRDLTVRLSKLAEVVRQGGSAADVAEVAYEVAELVDSDVAESDGWPAVDVDGELGDGQVPDMRHVLPAVDLRDLAATVEHALTDQQDKGVGVRGQAMFVAHYLAPAIAKRGRDLADARVQLGQAGAALAESLAASMQLTAHLVWLREVARRRHGAAERLRAELWSALADAERYRALVGGVCPQGVHAGWSVEPGHVYVCPCLLNESDVDGAL